MISIHDIKSIRTSRSDNMSVISWQLTLWCNYHCSYCIQSSQRAKKKPHLFPTYEKIIEDGKYLNTLIENSTASKVCLKLIGGEITYLDLPRLFTEVLTSDKIKVVYITTNLSRDSAFWETFTTYMQERNIKLKIYASLHLDQVKDLDDFIAKAKVFTDRVSFVVTPENFERTKIVMSKLAANNIQYYAELDRMLDWTNPDYASIVELFKSEAGKVNQFHGKYVELKDGTLLRLSRSELLAELDCQSFGPAVDFMCTTDLRLQGSKLCKGTCCYKKSLGLPSEEDLKNLASTDRCSLTSLCSLCGLASMESIDE